MNGNRQNNHQSSFSNNQRNQSQNLRSQTGSQHQTQIPIHRRSSLEQFSLSATYEVELRVLNRTQAEITEQTARNLRPSDHLGRMRFNIINFPSLLKEHNYLMFSLAKNYFVHYNECLVNSYQVTIDYRFINAISILYFFVSRFSENTYNVRVVLGFNTPSPRPEVLDHGCTCGRSYICHHIVSVLMKIEQSIVSTHISTSLVIGHNHPFSFEETDNDTDDEDNILNSSSDGEYFSESSCDSTNLNAKDLKCPVIAENRQNIENSLLGKEITCQICLDLIEIPVFMPCNSHSSCLNCIKKLIEEKRQSNGSNVVLLSCPTCGANSGKQYVSKIKNLKINKEMQRIIAAFAKEIDSWKKDKNILEKKIELLTKEKEKVDKDQEKEEKISLKSKKNVLLISHSRNSDDENQDLKRKTRLQTSKSIKKLNEEQIQNPELVQIQPVDITKRTKKRKL